MVYKREVQPEVAKEDVISALDLGDATTLSEVNYRADVALQTENSETIVIPSRKLNIGTERTCECGPTHLNCLTPKEWTKCQMGIWEFNYEKRDIRDKEKHPATYPIALARRCIELFSHKGQLVVDPFMGSGTTLLAARDAGRNAVGFDINPAYIKLTQERLAQDTLFTTTQQIPILDDARHIAHYFEEESITCVVTSPPYANLLNRKRKNKSRRGDERKNEQYMKVEQYSQRPEDLGTLDIDAYQQAMAEIFAGLLPLLKKKGHCVINVPDMWWENERVTIHIAVVEALRSVGYELRNTIIWNRMNIVNNVGIFGWPSNYITMGTTFEYLLDFWRPETSLFGSANVDETRSSLEEKKTSDMVSIKDDIEGFDENNIIHIETKASSTHSKPKSSQRKKSKPETQQSSLLDTSEETK